MFGGKKHDCCATNWIPSEPYYLHRSGLTGAIYLDTRDIRITLPSLPDHWIQELKTLLQAEKIRLTEDEFPDLGLRLASPLGWLGRQGRALRDNVIYSTLFSRDQSQATHDHFSTRSRSTNQSLSVAINQDKVVAIVALGRCMRLRPK